MTDTTGQFKVRPNKFWGHDRHRVEGWALVYGCSCSG